MTHRFQVHVQRYDPERQPAEYVQTYRVEYHDNMTVLEALEEIQHHQDSSLAFRSSCRIAKCGTCSVSLDGRPVLACSTMLDGRDVTVGPLPNTPVVKDLIVDRSRSARQMAATVEAQDQAEAADVAVPSPPPPPFDYGNLSRCIGCLVCESTCPVLAAMADAGVETESAFPGPAWLPTALGSGAGIEQGRGGQGFRCLLCGACGVACPSDVEADHVLELNREALAGRGLVPEPLAALDERIARAHNISGEPNQGRLVWTDNLATPPRGKREGQVDVVYFVGCVSSLFPRSYSVAQSFVQILDRAGLEYGLLGQEEWCCGYPMAVNGELDRARDSMRHNLDAVRARGARVLVTTCPSCLYFWKQVYPQVLGERLGFEVLHATEYMADMIETGHLVLRQDLPEAVVTYHDPCDLGRKGGIYDAPRRILAQVPNLELREMADNRESSFCCGGGGNLESLDAGLSKAVAARRIGQAAGTGASAVVSACQQCERTLSAAARAARIRIRVLDVSEIVLEAMSEAES